MPRPLVPRGRGMRARVLKFISFEILFKPALRGAGLKSYFSCTPPLWLRPVASKLARRAGQSWGVAKTRWGGIKWRRGCTPAVARSGLLPTVRASALTAAEVPLLPAATAPAVAAATRPLLAAAPVAGWPPRAHPKKIFGGAAPAPARPPRRQVKVALGPAPLGPRPAGGSLPGEGRASSSSLARDPGPP